MRIIGCGCSWTHGFYWKDSNINFSSRNKSYTQILAEKLSGDAINISMPGASNYGIAKQVEYAISHKPDLIVFNTTMDTRIDLIKANAGDFVQGTPTIRDFVYGRYKNSHILNENEIIYSRSFNFFVSGIPILNQIDDIDRLTEFILTYDKYVNSEMRRDQNRFTVMGTLSLLERSKIPYICVDLNNVLPLGYNDNIINLHYTELVSKYNIPEDEYHFNQEGHKFVSDLIHQKLIDLNVF